MSEYDKVILSSLKLKTSSKISKKKKKKKSKNKDVVDKAALTSSREGGLVHSGISKEGGSSATGGSHRDEEGTQSVYEDNRTRAEVTFEERREQKQMDRLLNKAEKSHKERIMDFNDHLGSLSEHFDVQKVSWTK